MKVYFDNAATTAITSSLLKQIEDLLRNQYYNADSLYDDAIMVKKLLETSRGNIATMLAVKTEEIIFTSGASEGNNLIIKGIVDYYQGKRKHLITTDIEHSSVKVVFDYYQELGYQVDRIKVNEKGELDFKQFKNLLKEDTLLVSIMSVNNEVGTILPVKELAEYTKANSRAFFHSDMTQSLGKLPIDLLNIDYASFSAHKFGGFKGSGFIYKRKGSNLLPLIMGGQQEFNLRAGTSNAPFQILLAKTLRLALDNDIERIIELNKRLIEGLSDIGQVKINGYNASPFIINFSLANLSSQVAINALAKKGIMVSGQSTCSSKKYEYSRVLKSMGFDETRCRNSLRVSFWYNNTIAEIEYFLKRVIEVINEYSL